jgi:hypothetical protein
MGWSSQSPTSRLTDDRVAQFASAARETASRIERALRLEGLSRPE